jgi:hypothetical protein
MKYIISLISLILLMFLSVNCGKETDDSKSDDDSIPLFYVEAYAGIDTAALPEQESVFYHYESTTLYYGPHPYEYTNVFIWPSNTDAVKLSCGKSDFAAMLDKDSLIDSNIYWQNRLYVSYQFDVSTSMYIKHKYIGIKQITGDQARYGWIKCGIDNQTGQYKFLEYAIDTSSINKGVVKAGRKYKSGLN